MNPYETLDEIFFWSPAVAKKSMFDINRLWDPKFKIGPKMKVATYGSCFAQHIGRALAGRNFNWMIAEPAPQGLSKDNSKKFNYGIFSARTGNIYTTTLLAQWVSWATGDVSPPGEVWEKGGRYYDPFRPNIEPNGFESREEMKVSRSLAVEAFKKSILECDVLVFTMGLTESWFNAEGGYEYPMCPGTVAGEFDEKKHQFVNQDYTQIRKALVSCLRGIKKLNPKLKVLLTVSPVPLTATMSGKHVLVATMESKSILRAVAGSVASELRFVDYFPSYEIINSAPYKGAFFEPNMRSVNPVGVNHVMDQFFSCLQDKFPLKLPEKRIVDAGSDDAVCEEELLNAFQGGGK
ncbi:GSCFA domain-containing protein [Halomonas halocynthiae]|uniref:GSCFA domain-containing protein n=1 Tax=Halomonas halocynthiae TaxID=176290 RepID=UPI00041F08AE|nr:GSCFA domain-containing protein [Halomonas halocynthiae]